MSRTTARVAAVREILARSTTTHFPAVHDGLSARIAERRGFELVSVTGSGLEATLLGRPDIGLTSMTEVVAAASRIASTVDIPVLLDADTGFGGPRNVWRLVDELRRAGVAGMFIEDQVSPKKCGFMAGRHVVPIAEMVGKVGAAHEAAQGELVIIARTDAPPEAGQDHLLDRTEAYLSAGADAVMLVGAYEAAVLEHVVREASGPVMVVGDRPWFGPDVDERAELARIGVRLVVHALSGVLAAAQAIDSAFALIARAGAFPFAPLDDLAMDFDEFNDLLGLPFWEDLDARFGT